MSQAPDGSAGEQSANASPGERCESNDSSLDAIFRLLGSERRRNALYVLYQRTGPLGVADLAAEVASLEDADPERVATALHHVHLPRLDAAGVVEFDGERAQVRLADHSERFGRYLNSAADDEGRPLRRASASARLSEF